MPSFPETDAEIFNLMKDKGEHHDQVFLDNNDVDAHLMILPKDKRTRVASEAMQSRTGEKVRVYLSCANYTPNTVEMDFDTKLSDQVAALGGTQCSGRFKVPPVKKGRGLAAGVNWRFAPIHSVVPDSRAEVICEWVPANADRSKGQEAIVKITTTQ